MGRATVDVQIQSPIKVDAVNSNEGFDFGAIKEGKRGKPHVKPYTFWDPVAVVVHVADWREKRCHGNGFPGEVHETLLIGPVIVGKRS